MNDSPPQRRFRLLARWLRSSSGWVFVLTFVPLAAYAMCAVKKPTAWQRTQPPVLYCGIGGPLEEAHVQGWPWGYLARNSAIASFAPMRLWLDVSEVTPALLIANLAIAALLAGLVARTWQAHLRRGRWWQISLKEWLAVTGAATILIGCAYRPLLDHAKEQRVIEQLEGLGWYAQREEVQPPGWFQRPWVDAGLMAPESWFRVTGVTYEKPLLLSVKPRKGGLPAAENDIAEFQQACELIATLKHLDAIDIRTDYLTDQALQLLCSQGRHCRRATLTDTRRLTDAGVCTMVECWPDLVQLDLSGTAISPQGVAQLAQLKGLTIVSLRELKHLPVEGAMRLIETLPSLELLQISDDCQQHPDFQALAQWAEKRGVRLVTHPGLSACDVSPF